MGNLNTNIKKGDKWYIKKMDLFDNEGFSGLYSVFQNSYDKSNMIENYNLYNNKINISDYAKHVSKLDLQLNRVSKNIKHHDVVSKKIKFLEGVELEKTLNFNVIAVNPEATQRRERAKKDMIKQFAVNEILNPIRQQISVQYQEQLQNKNLSQQEKAEILKKIEDETKRLTPDEVRKYIERDYKDTSEVLGDQILNYVINRNKIKDKFDICFKDGLISGIQVVYLSNFNENPDIWPIKPYSINTHKVKTGKGIEDNDWLTCDYYMTKSEIINKFSKELTRDKIKKIDLEKKGSEENNSNDKNIYYQTDTIAKNINDTDHLYFGNILEEERLKVRHFVWKDVVKVKFVTFFDPIEEENITIITDNSFDESEKENIIEIEERYISYAYEGWRIYANEELNVFLRPVPSQNLNIEDFSSCKLPYYGCFYDNIDGNFISLLDRLKPLQYNLDIILSKAIEIMLKNKGKVFTFDQALKPVNIENDDFFRHLENGVIVTDSSETRYQGGDPRTLIQVSDLSEASTIAEYLNYAKYLNEQIGETVGITSSVEGQIEQYAKAGNTQQSLIQSNRILKSLFNTHEIFKQNVLQALLELAKTTYSEKSNKVSLSFLDDISIKNLQFDPDELSSNTLAVFVKKDFNDKKEIINQIAMSSVQSGNMPISDVIELIEAPSLNIAKEKLKSNETKNIELEERRRQEEMELKREEMRYQAEESEKQHQRELEKIILKEEERRKTEVEKASLMAASFNPEQDKDKDGVNDFIEQGQKMAELDKKESIEDKKIRSKEKIEKMKLDYQNKRDKKR